MEYNRRKFISFLGKAGIGIVVPPFLIHCGNSATLSKIEKMNKLNQIEA
ncbi:hypothetical protein [Aquimarina sp. 2201CG5-10]|nr:hypothetical protein [Aquimarina sp. 2201CG5-10]MDY8137949.1 hypothetical protein [Aquimarina sp. 2201CG5-10]